MEKTEKVFAEGFMFKMKPNSPEWVVGSKPDAKAALNASVSAIYFSDSSDYRSYHYQVIRSLTGLDEVTEINISKLFNELNPE